MLPPPSEDTRIAELMRRVENLESALRAAFTTISGGAGIRVVDGGTLALVAADGTVTFYIGPVTPRLPDGTRQQGWIVRREDDTPAMALYDPDPSVDFKQFLALYDRLGNIYASDDTESGQGMARPYVPFAFYRSRSSDWPTVNTTSFQTLYRARGPKQQPKLYVVAWLHATAAGAVAEMQVVVNGSAWGAPQQSNAAFVTELVFGPLPVGGAHMSQLSIEIQARIVSGGGTAEVGVARVEGRQT